MTGPSDLIRAVKRRLQDCTVRCTRREVESFQSSAWASATFEGQRHAFTLRIDGDAESVDSAALRLCGVLLESEIALPGQLLADLAIIGEDTVTVGGTQARRLHFEALTVLD